MSYRFYLGVDSVWIEPGGYAVFGYSNSSLGSLVDYTYGSNVNGTSLAGATYNTSFPLANSGTVTVRISLGGVVLDELSYMTASPWPSSANGYAIELGKTKLNATDNDTGSNWCIASSKDIFYSGTWKDYGTPGSANTCTR